MTTESVNIYYPDDKQVWVPAEIISEVDTGSYEMLIYDSIEFDYCSTKIITNSSDITTFKNSFPSRTDQFPEDGFDDLLSLNSIHEGSILDNLELRFKAENPYTNAGNICIAMNPYQWLNNLYSEDTK